MSTKVIKSEQKSNFITFHLPADQAKLLFPILKNTKCFERLEAFLEAAESISYAIDDALVYVGQCEFTKLDLARRIESLLSIKNLVEEIRVSQANYSFSAKSYRTRWQAENTELAQSYFINQTFNDIIQSEFKKPNDKQARDGGERKALLNAHFFHALNSRLEVLKEIGDAEAIPKELAKSLRVLKSIK